MSCLEPVLSLPVQEPTSSSGGAHLRRRQNQMERGVGLGEHVGLGEGEHAALGVCAVQRPLERGRQEGQRQHQATRGPRHGPDECCDKARGHSANKYIYLGLNIFQGSRGGWGVGLEGFHELREVRGRAWAAASRALAPLCAAPETHGRSWWFAFAPSPDRAAVLSRQAMATSALFVMDLKGKIIISRNYRGDVPMSVSERCAGGPSALASRRRSANQNLSNA